MPPDRIARSLPTKTKPTKAEKPQTSTTKPKNVPAQDARGTKRKRALHGESVSASTKVNHDTPRAFRRLMALASGKRVRAGLDTGVVETKKQKKQRMAKERTAKAVAAAAAEMGAEGEPDEAAAAPAPAPAPEDAAALTIRPGERLSEFNARVDAALPLAGIIKKSMPGGAGGKDPLGLAKTYRTRQERKLHKLYDQWRQDDAKIKEKEAEAREEAEERDAALDETLGVKWRLDFQQASGGKGKASRKRRANDAGGGDDDDVWAAFNRKKGAATKSTVRAGVHDTVEAPPELTKIDSSKFNLAKFKTKAGRGAEEAEPVAAQSLPTAKGVNKRLAGGRISKPGRGPSGSNRRGGAGETMHSVRAF